MLQMDASGEQGVVKPVPEILSDAMRARGWHVMATDSELLPPPEIEPAQSNPRRKD